MMHFGNGDKPNMHIEYRNYSYIRIQHRQHPPSQTYLDSLT